jgi:hypothetical protein
MTSRREAKRELSRPAFVATLQELFPELETLPPADALHRLLSQLDVTYRSFMKEFEAATILTTTDTPQDVKGLPA